MDFIIFTTISFILLVLYKYLIYPALLSPLKNLPSAHPTTHFSNLWIRYQRFINNSNHAIQSAHERFGPIVRLGATEVSVNNVDALRIVYGGNWDRDDWYRSFSNYGHLNMFSMIGKKEHTERKRMFGNVYSKTTLYSSKDFGIIAQTLSSRLSAVLEDAAKKREGVEVQGLLSCVTNDFISAYIFGLDNIKDFLRDMEARTKWLEDGHELKQGVWSSTITRIGEILTKNGIIRGTRREEQDECLQMLNGLEKSKHNKKDSISKDENSERTKPIIYNQLLHHLFPHHHKDASLSLSPQDRLLLASEFKDHLIAGTETTTWTMTYILHSLSLRPDLQHRLREELLPLSSIHTNAISQSFLRTLDTLPLLNATILETLRLYPSVPGSQLRVSPPNSTSTLCGYKIPPNTKVSAQAYSLHRTAAVFPSPEEWRPDRWLQATKEEREEMMRWFWGFGSGARGCIGKEFAMLELKILVVVIYGRFETRVVDCGGIKQGDGYSVGPKGRRILLEFKKM
ncbi:cytochrome P450 [Mollisia scopiformis]|uniref:Cytochrome P450 n=1 Tax=Mollisia scopiformis TaxID=149040 RepID=A0A194X193_MOLSC|nr:cytochrome P450 [Mollisia scopiformis]KUJ13958.1 cytochrome P450 [Mollisia scopiformis]